MKKLSAALAALLAAACAATPSLHSDADGAGSFDGSRIRAHMSFLADDALAGRYTASPEYLIAANYVASQFALAGLEPGAEGGFFQSVPFRPYTEVREGIALRLETGEAAHALEYGNHFGLSAGPAAEVTEFSGQLVFAGRGLDIPGRGLDDYAGLDVDGKVVLVLPGTAKELSAAERGYYGGAGKYAAADARGAVAVFTLVPKRKDAGSDPPGETDASAETKEKEDPPPPPERLRWAAPDGTQVDRYPNIAAAGRISQEALEPVFEAAGLDLAGMIADWRAGKEVQSTDLPGTLAGRYQTKLGDLKYSPNVVGVLRGGDPDLRDDYVVLTAHLDHLGTRGGGIANGALDNAAGVAVMLEVAAALKASPVPPRRSIVFVALTGEEIGQQGAQFFTHFPTIPAGRIVANVNLDMPLLLYDFADVLGLGAGHSSLGGNLEAAAESMGLALSADPVPERRYFTRSDHYSFVQKGVPAIMLMLGFTSTTPEAVDGAEIFQNFMKNGYHSPADNLSLPIRYDVAGKFAELNLRLLLSIANADARPVWSASSLYGRLFAAEPPTEGAPSLAGSRRHGDQNGE